MTDRRLAAFVFSVALMSGCVASPAAAGTAFFADGFESGDTCTWSAGSSSCTGMHLATPTIALDPFETAFYCYYFHASNANAIAARKIASYFGPAVVDIMWFQTFDATSGLPADRLPPGTLSDTDCGFLGGNGTIARWSYSAHHPVEAVTMPSDDGAGNPLALEIGAGQPGFVQIFLSNPTPNAVTAEVLLDAIALPGGTPYTETAGLFAYNELFSIGTGIQTRTSGCTPAAGAKFWWFSTRTHSHGTEAKLEKLESAVATTILVTSNWADPTIQTYGPPTFFGFGTGLLRYTCTWDNQTGHNLSAGNDPVDDENCVGLGYFFPTTGPRYCLSGGTPQ
jgi:hypothetical protein